jgi:preprotein translocase subunit SecD
MSKKMRFGILLIVLVLCGWVLFPTINWYFIIPNQVIEGFPEDQRDLLMIGEDELYAQTQEVRNRIEYLKETRKKALSLGLDLSGGVYISAQVDENDLRRLLLERFDYDERRVDSIFNEEFTLATDRALDVLRNRMDQFGVASPVIRKTFGDRISIELPGLDNPQMIRDALSRVGRLEFMLVDETTMEKLSRARVPMQQGYVVNREDVPEDFDIPDDSAWMAYWESDETGRPFVKGWYVLKDRVEMDGTAIRNATPDTDQRMGGFVINFQLTPEGTDIFQELTGQNIGTRLAIVLDGKVQSAPNINSEIVGSGVITGNFTFDETVFLARVLKAGSLPVQLEIMEEKIIGPTLGADSIRAGGMAFIIGAIAVVIFMIIYYRGAGIISFVALTLNIVFLLAFLALMRATLTLPGIAGIALTVGMAVDANTIIYERIREEMRRSRSFKHALDNGYQNARSTIWDANLTTLIAAFALSSYGTKEIQGFGITLSFGIISNIFAALFVTRLIFDWLIDSFKLKKVSI